MKWKDLILVLLRGVVGVNVKVSDGEDGVSVSTSCLLLWGVCPAFPVYSPLGMT